jgi:3,4-dihydroxyphenylacetate 2,3-dioxygenase
MKQIPYDMPGDPELAKLIAAQADGRDDCWILANDDPYLPLFYGTVNIWTFLGDPDTAWLSVALNQCCNTDDFLLFGELIGNAIRESDRRVVLLASGGMTHRFFNFKDLRTRESQKAPDNIYDMKYYEADMKVLDMMQKGDHAGVIDGMPEYRKAYPEGHFGHYLMMASALGGRSCKAPGELFSEYEASVGTGQVHVWFEKPERGWTA